MRRQLSIIAQLALAYTVWAYLQARLWLAVCRQRATARRLARLEAVLWNRRAKPGEEDDDG